MPSELKHRSDEEGATSGPAFESHQITMHMADKSPTQECDDIDAMPELLQTQLRAANARARHFNCRIPSPDCEFGSKIVANIGQILVENRLLHGYTGGGMKGYMILHFIVG